MDGRVHGDAAFDENFPECQNFLDLVDTKDTRHVAQFLESLTKATKGTTAMIHATLSGRSIAGPFAADCRLAGVRMEECTYISLVMERRTELQELAMDTDLPSGPVDERPDSHGQERLSGQDGAFVAVTKLADLSFRNHPYIPMHDMEGA